MEPFKFVDTGSGPTFLESGVPFNGYDTLAWTERYRLAGDFKIKAPLSSGLKTELPVGTLISHVDTYEVCVVENHELKEEQNEPPQLEISGRSLEAFSLENRIVGATLAGGVSTVPPAEYNLAADTLADQVAKIITDHIGSTALPNDQLPYVLASVFSSVFEGAIEARVIKRQVLHKAVLDLLAINDYGIRVIRMNDFTEGLATANTLFHIHKGNDRTAEVIFSWHGGDLETADYLWSTKTLKNVALVRGRYVERLVYGTPAATGLARRTMLVDASDLDDIYDTTPTGGTLTAIQAKMDIRGRQALDNQQEVSITRTDISPNSQLRYRQDYQIGDIVSVDGNFGDIETRRVIEYLEIDEDGSTTGHPTLADIPPNAIL